ncbi:MAG: hypothetical protein ACXVH2_08455 [Methanobacterium sp.]
MDIEQLNADCPHKSPVVTATVGAAGFSCCGCAIKSWCPFSNC